MTSILLIVFLPLAAALVGGVGGRVIGPLATKILTTGALFVAAALSWPVFLGFLSETREAAVVPVSTWIASGAMDAVWSLRVDALTAVMLVVITSVSALVHLYSWGYMEEDPSQSRFFAYLSLFTFAMLMLVTADNLVQMFFGWEGVGLASYLLIGFWYHKPSANAAAIKAFVVNRVGDLGFMLGIFGTYLVFGTVSIPAILEAVPTVAGSTVGFLGGRVDTLSVLCVLLFIGAMGKSAQLGLHTWLPDAMEGPTPVSALIHAATMVTAGVFMVCRLSPLFEASGVMGFVTFIGAATCLFAATVALVQTDIKRVIAYSTCSQLGYMFFAAGVGAYPIAMFHLFTHAFFKALLFLGAGSVIHSMHHEQDMRFYGALWRRIPITFWGMMAGTLAITGVGVAGVFGFAGFYSKDAILEAAFAAGGGGRVAFVVGTLVALLTSFYSWRLMFLTFFGEARWAGSEHIVHAMHDGHAIDPAGEDAGHEPALHGPAAGQVATGTGGYHPHEAPWSMLLPLVLLGVGAVFAGWAFHGPFAEAREAARFFGGSVFVDTHLLHAMHEVPVWVKWSATVAMLIGLALAWAAYRPGGTLASASTEQFRVLYRVLQHKWYFDELYDAVFVRPAFALGRVFWRDGDQGLIDKVGPNGVAAASVFGQRVLGRFQTGYLYNYAFVMLIGVAAAITWVALR